MTRASKLYEPLDTNRIPCIKFFGKKITPMFNFFFF